MVSFSMIAAVSAGGALGAVLRYLVSLWVGVGLFGMPGPMATLVVNIVGSALMGMLSGWIALGIVIPEVWRNFLAVGLLGALTTFSSFALDAGNLFQKQGIVLAGGYVALSVVLSLAAFAMGFWVLRYSGFWQ